MAMNIKDAKKEIMNILQAYLTKDELGNYMISINRQRPVLLMGPPGIGKTQIMEQIAQETGVGLVSYTLTHHTRQSAIGLPFIEQHNYDGLDVPITQYTMSEILASVYDLMERMGQKEGILFLDEINCVSETLTPVMLQFLQNKTFGNRKLPEGWLIVAAGNPPEYNKSAHEFDIVTLDRVKRIDIVEDFSVWKEYAYRKGLHGAIISYLDIKKENFYRLENSIDGMRFATARGWEDLSEVLLAYETIGLSVDRQVIEQYIQFPLIAKDFANYLDLYYKYQSTYHVEEILTGEFTPLTVRTLQTAPFDEKLSVMGLLYSRLLEYGKNTRMADTLTERLHETLSQFRDGLADTSGSEAMTPSQRMEEIVSAKQEAMKVKVEAKALSKEERELVQREINALESYRQALRQQDATSDTAMDIVRKDFQSCIDAREHWVEETSQRFDNAFAFLEQSVGQHQEMVLFVTEITAGYDTSWFIQNFGCDAYYRHNKDLLMDDVEQRIRGEIQSLRKASDGKALDGKALDGKESEHGQPES